MRKIQKGFSLLLAFMLTVGTMLSSGLVVQAAKGDLISGTSPITEPYAYVSQGSFSGPEQPYSPDPLVGYRWDNPLADDNLEIFLRRPASVSSKTPGNFIGMQSLTSEAVSVEVTGEGSIMLDFGTEFAGWLEIDSPDLSGSITLGVSEYNAPAFVNSGPQSPSKTAAPVKYGNTYRLELNSELYEGARFGFINVTKFVSTFHITGVRLVCQTKPVNYNGSFDSDNEMLNRIWYTAAYDVRMNLKKDYFAAILVDRGDRHSWTGDAYPAQAAALAAFGNYDFVLRNLQYTAVRPNGIESYELYWIFSLVDYYKYTGDKAGVQGLLSHAKSRLDHAYAIYGSNPGLGFFGWDERLGAGFENPNNPETQNAYKMLSIRAWKEFAPVLEDLGLTAAASRYLGYAQEKTQELYSDPAWYSQYGLHASADAMNAGVVPGELMDTLFETYFTDRVNRLSYSPFNQYFLLQAMGKAGRYDEAISSILDMWGGQVEYGGTAFFETFRPEWNDVIEKNAPVPNNQAGYTSLAHPWGAGVLTWMSEEILGIKTMSAGFKSFEVKPHLGRQLTRASGSVPTNFGIIEASFDTAAGTAHVLVPNGTTAYIAIPKVEKIVSNILVNGNPASVASQDDDFVYLTGLPGGDYQFTMAYAGQTPAYTEASYKYPAEFVREDSKTQGNWGGVYGSEGYVLCAYNQGDLRDLPDYVSSISYRKARSALWESNTDDVRALSGNALNEGKRSIGTLYTGDPIACEQTFTVDIGLKEEKEYTVALYFVDWDKKGRQLAVEMFDGETLNMIAPVQVLDDYSGGKYLVYKYNRSARFRIDQIRGDNATLSGIFFGEGKSQKPVTLINTVDDREASIRYEGAQWTFDPMPGAYQNTFSYTNVANASAIYAFSGTGVTYIASKESNRGIAEIFVDEISHGKVDLYSASKQQRQEVFTLDGLEDGPHTIRVVVTGQRNPSSSGAYVDVDAFTVRRVVMPDPLPVQTIRAEDPQSGEVVSEVTAKENFVVTATVADSVTAIRLFNENNINMGRTDMTVTDNENGTKTFRFVMNIGTAGKNRVFTLYTKTANSEEYTVTDVMLSLDVLVLAPAIVSVGAPESAKVNEPFNLTVMTNQGVSKIDVTNESGSKIGILSSTYVDTVQGRVWTVQIRIGSKGTARTLNVYGKNSGGDSTKAANVMLDILPV